MSFSTRTSRPSSSPPPRTPGRKRVSAKGIVNAVLWPVVAFVVFLGVWAIISERLPKTRKFILPSPWAVVRDGFGSADVRSELLRATWFTAKEALFGLAIASVIGIGLAVVMSQARWIERAVYPWAVVLQTIPILALVPLIGFWFGFGLFSRVLVCVLIAVFPIISTTLFGLRSVDRSHHDLFTLYRAGRLTRLVKLQWPPRCRRSSPGCGSRPGWP